MVDVIINNTHQKKISISFVNRKKKKKKREKEIIMYGHYFIGFHGRIENKMN